MLTPAQYEALKALGKEWRKGEYDRLYINDLPRLYGLEISCYKTGNISYATLDGEKISNSECRRLLSKFDKLWYDNVTRTFESKGMDRETHEILVEAIMRHIQETARPEQPGDEDLVRCSCGHSVPRISVMQASLGTSCPDCYDRMSA